MPVITMSILNISEGNWRIEEAAGIVFQMRLEGRVRMASTLQLQATTEHLQDNNGQAVSSLKC